jgi:hypothetical protein
MAESNRRRGHDDESPGLVPDTWYGRRVDAQDSARLLAFQSASTTQTLAEGLAEYYAANAGLKRGATLSPDAQAFFRSHDAVHVLYGCGTTMPDEAVVKLASLFGTSAGFSVLRGYLLHDSIDIYRRLPFGSTVKALVMAPYLIARTLWRCMHQRDKWPWADFERHANTPLRELRGRFGITVAHRG